MPREKCQQRIGLTELNGNMPHAGHFGVKSAAKRNRMARNKARAKQVSDEQFNDNWDKIFGDKNAKKSNDKK